jgi:monoamine oxidase
MTQRPMPPLHSAVPGQGSSSITRRGLLHGAAVAAGVAAHGSSARASAGEVLDVAVVGAGVSGLHAAWRLLTADPATRIAVFEASARIGGRLHSFRFVEAPHAVAEVGGMRFLSDHVLVERLVAHLGLGKRTFINAGGANLLDLRGRSLRYDAIGQTGSVFDYGMSPGEQRAGPEALLHRAADAIVPGATGLGAAEWSAVRRRQRLDGRLLRDWSLRPALAQVLDFERLRFLAAASGYDQMVDGPNAADMLQLMLAHDMPGDTVSTLVDGYQSLPLRLADKVTEGGGEVLREHRLMSVTPVREGGATLFHFDFATPSGRTSVAARKVIFAMGRTAIESVLSPLAVDPRARALIAAVAPWPMVKTFLVYPEPWWRRLGITAGRSVTDMPARQIWYFGTEDEPDGEPGNRTSLLMTYCDADSVG